MTTIDHHVHAAEPAPEAREHEHAWVTASRHRTSHGDVLYVRCEGCGAHRVDVQTAPETPPSAISVEIGNKDGVSRVEPHRLKSV
ncbi:hypothetical protein [Pseudactinotalea sp.]|uniref:hypothetical protein n=1 Tax=Pseudactinotalea sp. TaxID=1926260 RepID=UPI003B3A86EC